MNSSYDPTPLEQTNFRQQNKSWDGAITSSGSAKFNTYFPLFTRKLQFMGARIGYISDPDPDKLNNWCWNRLKTFDSLLQGGTAEGRTYPFTVLSDGTEIPDYLPLTNISPEIYNKDQPLESVLISISVLLSRDLLNMGEEAEKFHEVGIYAQACMNNPLPWRRTFVHGEGINPDTAEEVEFLGAYRKNDIVMTTENSENKYWRSVEDNNLDKPGETYFEEINNIASELWIASKEYNFGDLVSSGGRLWRMNINTTLYPCGIPPLNIAPHTIPSPMFNTGTGELIPYWIQVTGDHVIKKQSKWDLIEFEQQEMFPSARWVPVPGPEGEPFLIYYIAKYQYPLCLEYGNALRYTVVIDMQSAERLESIYIPQEDTIAFPELQMAYLMTISDALRASRTDQIMAETFKAHLIDNNLPVPEITYPFPLPRNI
jgi:hypothetical protein